jgi:hypothetical protein
MENDLDSFVVRSRHDGLMRQGTSVDRGGYLGSIEKRQVIAESTR